MVLGVIVLGLIGFFISQLFGMPYLGTGILLAGAIVLFVISLVVKDR